MREFLSHTNILNRYDALIALTLTAQGDLRSEKVILTKYVKDRLPDAVELLRFCAEIILKTREKLNSLSLIKNSHHLFHIGEAVLERYGSLKRARGVIDFDDQVEKCANLLTRSEIREWIRYRLDRGIDHMLVDEAQDTSPRQWEVINAITGDFHSGNSASMRQRTVFVVGDEKQSIYSFQGADPAAFEEQRARYRDSLEA
ncbi:MAG: UvrD-helicase domain-containing protein, partial [Bacteroidota bacterium]